MTAGKKETRRAAAETSLYCTGFVPALNSTHDSTISLVTQLVDYKLFAGNRHRAERFRKRLQLIEPR